MTELPSSRGSVSLLTLDSSLRVIGKVEVDVLDDRKRTPSRESLTTEDGGVKNVVVCIHEFADLFGIVYERPRETDYSPFTVLGSGDTSVQTEGGFSYNPLQSSRLRSADDQIERIISAIENCSPAMRRRLARVLNAFPQDLDSLYPLRPDNPLLDTLGYTLKIQRSSLFYGGMRTEDEVHIRPPE